jgi:hypothetical protein
MSAPLVPSPLDFVGRRRFSFYPPIRNAEPNEWLLGTGSWSEVQVVNAQTGLQVWIGRRYIGGVSNGNGVGLVVELTKELLYQSGELSPRVKGVIEMPCPARAHGKPTKKRRRRSGPALVVGIKIEADDPARSRTLAKLGLGAVALCLLAALLTTIAKL